MAVSVDYQAWASAAYNWQDTASATAASQQINDKLAAWVAAVNSNASNATSQITVLKGPTDSTNASYVGWTLQLSSATTGSTFYIRLHTNSTTNMYAIFGENWADDGAQGGYGGVIGSYSQDASISWVSSGQSAEFAVATETQDGQEFFCLGWNLQNNTSYSDVFLIFKDENGEWAALVTDGGWPTAGTFYMPVQSTPGRQFGVTVYQNLNISASYLSSLVLWASPVTVAVGESFGAGVKAASPALLTAGTSTNWRFGRWSALASGQTAVSMGYSTIWVTY